jgi:hypothetical protein
METAFLIGYSQFDFDGFHEDLPVSSKTLRIKCFAETANAGMDGSANRCFPDRAAVA